MSRRPPIELRAGVKVRFGPDRRLGELVRSSPNGEEWLVKDRFGKFWVATNRLILEDEGAEPTHRVRTGHERARDEARDQPDDHEADNAHADTSVLVTALVSAATVPSVTEPPPTWTAVPPRRIERLSTAPEAVALSAELRGRVRQF